MSSGCIFCDIVAGITPADVVHQDEETVFFRDISPKARVHIVGISKKHIASLNEMVGDDVELMGKLLLVVKKVAQESGLTDGYRVLTNVGLDAGQEVPHLHWHILGGEKLKGIN